MKRMILASNEAASNQLLEQANQSLYDTWWNYAEDNVSYSWVVRKVINTVKFAFTDDEIPLPKGWRDTVKKYVEDHYDDYDW